MKKTIFIAAALVAMTACNKNVIEMPVAEGFGYIDFGLTAETEMVVLKSGTKAGTPSFEGYNVTLKKDGVAVDGWPKEYENINDADWKVPAGTYTVYVENLNVEQTYETDKGVVRVSGESDPITVAAGVSTPCSVECTPQNSKVSFCYSPEFDTVFDPVDEDFSVSLKESEDRTVQMTVGELHADENAAYFEVGELEWTLQVKLNGETKTYTKKVNTIMAKWTQITFTTGSTDGKIGIQITVNGEITVVDTVTATVDPFSGNVETIRP